MDCQNYGSCLVAALFEFFFRNAVCYDPCSGADADLTFFLVYKTDRNAAIKVSCKIQISDRAAVNASFALFQLFDDLAGTELRCPGKCSCREDGVDCIYRIFVFSKLSCECVTVVDIL